MMAELLRAVVSWPTLLVVVLSFGFVPGFVLRLLVMIYPRDDPRRRELVSQLYVLRRLERPFFVAEQLETVLFEGVPHRAGTFRATVSRLAGRNLRALVRYRAAFAITVLHVLPSTAFVVGYLVDDHPRVHPLVEPSPEKLPTPLLVGIAVVINIISIACTIWEDSPRRHSNNPQTRGRA